MTHTKIKICGITNVDDAHCAIETGVDALGFMLYAKSKRYIQLENALRIIREIEDKAVMVAVLVNADEDYTRRVADQDAFDLLQFHGDETDQFCASFGKPYMKVIRVGVDTHVSAEINKYPGSRWMMLDSLVKGKYGGTGTSIQWDKLESTSDASPKPIVLAGGLTSNNVVEAIRKVKPYGVDVSGGVEKAEMISGKWVKDHDKISEFVRQVRRTDSEEE